MSFTLDNTVTINYPQAQCYDCLSSVEGFEAFMRLSDITISVKITSRDEVHITDDLKVLPIPVSVSDTDTDTDTPGPPAAATAPNNAEDHERCQRIHFELVERVVYVGIAKEVTVVGWVAFSDKHKVHIEHRNASDGLVITDKTRLFRDITSALPREDQIGSESNGEEPIDSKLDSLVVDDDDIDPFKNSAQADSDSHQDITEIHETLQGTTSWYLKYFTEIEAKRGHLAIMDRYGEYIAQYCNSCSALQ